jgi:DNA polymerase III gamma/tau subunit
MLAEGSYRDALSVLQKVFAGTDDKKLSREEVESATGAPRREQVHALVSALATAPPAGGRGRALEAIEKAAKADVDMKLFLELVLEALRATLLIRYAPELCASLADELGTDEFSALDKFAKEKGITHATMLAFLTASERIRYAPIPALPLELAVLELFSNEQQK